MKSLSHADHEARRCMVVHTALQAPNRLCQMRSFALKLSASGCQGDGCTEELVASSLESRGPEQRLFNKSCTLHSGQTFLSFASRRSLVFSDILLLTESISLR
ncbi:unnamed protein product [Polarella glacialis]|uniref:Uncharacterized protein n=1 Tax=Polarella glacialis TaxID=89957 RepID=A0A813KW11_POLGL|nr:unnamed protein product [Polarella glacialis]CAE8713756.1 unnamed protein product [Polarella glacialis]